MAINVLSQNKNYQVNEILKCGKDPIYFIKNYCRIQHPKRGMIPFETYPFQDQCIHDFVEHRLNIVLKSRQLGLSTISAAYSLWFTIFHKDKNVLVIATKLPTAINFIKKIKVMLENLPPWLLLTKFEPTKQSIAFTNGSSVTAIPTSDDAGRSEGLSLLIVDECAFIRDFEDIWTGLAPTISTGGSAIILSTPNGVGGQYYRLWMEAISGQNDFHTTRLLWNVHPEHDQAWYDKETRSLTRRKIAQEYLCDFISSGDTFLQPNDIDELRAQILEPIEKTGHDRNVWIWKRSVPGHRYVISADVSRGDARDFSAFHVIDANECSVSAEYMGKVSPSKLADMMADWGKVYNNALLVPENNTFGYFTNVRLRDDLNYRCLYYASNAGDPFNYMPLNSDEQPGFSTNKSSRTQILSKFEDLIRTKKLHSHSRRLYDQIQAFIWNGNKPEASKDSYDDLIMSLAIGCWLVDGSSGVSEQDREMMYALLNATKVDRRDINKLPGGINDAQPLVNPNIRGMNAHSVYRPQDASQVSPRNPYQREISDYSWLTL